VIVEHALLPVRAGMSDEFRSELIHPMNRQGRVALKLVGRAWNPSDREIVGPTTRRNIVLHNEIGDMRHLLATLHIRSMHIPSRGAEALM
jgi:hypothetical protein